MQKTTKNLRQLGHQPLFTLKDWDLLKKGEETATTEVKMEDFVALWEHCVTSVIPNARIEIRGVLLLQIAEDLGMTALILRTKSDPRCVLRVAKPLTSWQN